MAVAISAHADIAPVISWTVDVGRQSPYALSLRRGETVILQPTYLQNGLTKDLTGSTQAVMRIRPTATEMTYALTGTVYSATGGIVRIRWDVAETNSAAQYEISVTASNAVLMRAYGSLSIHDSLSGDLVTPPSGSGDTFAPSEPEGDYPNDIAPVLAWTVDPSQLSPVNHVLRQGETVILQPTFLGIDLSGAAAAVLRYRPLGASGWHYLAHGAVHDSTGGVVRVRWDSTIEGTNTAYQYEILAQSLSATLNRCYGTLTIQPSLSGSATSMPTAVTVFDWSLVDHVNIGSAPFLSDVVMAPFAAFDATLTNGTADLDIKNLNVRGTVSGFTAGSGSYSNTIIAGVSHTGAVTIANGSNTIWRYANGAWSVHLTNVSASGGSGIGSYTNTIINGIPNTNKISIADGDNVAWVLGTDGVWRASSTVPESWATTGSLYWVVNGVTIGRVDTNGITLLKGSLQLYEDDLTCNVRLYDGSRLDPSLTPQGHTNTIGMYVRGHMGSYGFGFSHAGSDILMISASGLISLSTNTIISGRHVGDLSGATNYPEPLFVAWSTNISYPSFIITTNGSLTINGAWTNAFVLNGSNKVMSAHDAAGVARCAIDAANGTFRMKSAGSQVKFEISDAESYFTGVRTQYTRNAANSAAVTNIITYSYGLVTSFLQTP